MTTRASGRARGIPRIWILPFLGLTSLLAITALGVLSRSFVLDFVAWWPVWALLLVLSFVVRGRRIGRVRLSGLIPLVGTVGLILLVFGHLQGWPGVPSGSLRLVGPGVGGIEQAELSASLDGVLRVGGGSDFLYRVEPVRRGGAIGVPDAVEQTTGTTATVVLGSGDTPGFYGFAGWVVALSPEPMWTLNLEGEVEADLSSLSVAEATISGTGVVVVGFPVGETSVTLDGEFELVVPPGTPVAVVGDAEVPEGWRLSGNAWTAPTEGSGWVFELSGSSSVVVTER